MTTRPYFDVISGADGSPAARAARVLLAGAAVVYRGVVAGRNLAYDAGWIRSRQAGAPVVAIGNLTAGGTGKTPVVAWTVNRLRSLGRQPGLISRGYGALPSGENDEKRLLDQLCPGTPHLQNRRRAEAVVQMLADSSVDVFVLDDAFQHRQLARDLNVVLIDATNPWGYGALLPRGLLREPRSSLRRADIILITRSDLIPSNVLADLREEITRWSPSPLLATAFLPSGWCNVAGDSQPLPAFTGARAVAVCAIGNPAGFLATLNRAGIPVLPEDLLSFPDHHHYTASDGERIRRFAAERNAELVLTTRKDLVKMDGESLRGMPVWALNIELTFLDSPAAYLERLQRLPPRAT